MKQSSRRLVSVKNNFSKRKKKLKPHYLRLLSRANFALQKKMLAARPFLLLKKNSIVRFVDRFFAHLFCWK